MAEEVSPHGYPYMYGWAAQSLRTILHECDGGKSIEWIREVAVSGLQWEKEGKPNG